MMHLLFKSVYYFSANISVKSKSARKRKKQQLKLRKTQVTNLNTGNVRQKFAQSFQVYLYFTCFFLHKGNCKTLKMELLKKNIKKKMDTIKN